MHNFGCLVTGRNWQKILVCTLFVHILDVSKHLVLVPIFYPACLSVQTPLRHSLIASKTKLNSYFAECAIMGRWLKINSNPQNNYDHDRGFEWLAKKLEPTTNFFEIPNLFTYYQLLRQFLKMIIGNCNLQRDYHLIKSRLAY